MENTLRDDLKDERARRAEQMRRMGVENAALKTEMPAHLKAAMPYDRHHAHQNSARVVIVPARDSVGESVDLAFGPNGVRDLRSPYHDEIQFRGDMPSPVRVPSAREADSIADRVRHKEYSDYLTRMLNVPPSQFTVLPLSALMICATLWSSKDPVDRIRARELVGMKPDPKDVREVQERKEEERKFFQNLLTVMGAMFLFSFPRRHFSFVTAGWRTLSVLSAAMVLGAASGIGKLSMTGMRHKLKALSAKVSTGFHKTQSKGPHLVAMPAPMPEI